MYWHTEHEKRPDFKTIVRALELDAISSHSLANDEYFDPTPLEIGDHSLNNDVIAKFVDDLQTDSSVLILIANFGIVVAPKFCKFKKICCAF
jgi:hypothetical protein